MDHSAPDVEIWRDLWVGCRFVTMRRICWADLELAGWRQVVLCFCRKSEAEEFPSQMPVCAFRGGMLSPRDRNVFHKFPEAREWVSDSWTRVHGDANYHLPPLTLPTSDFLKSVSGNFVCLSLRIRLRCSAACCFALRVTVLSGIGPNLMENDVGIVGFKSSGCLQRIFHIVS